MLKRYRGISLSSRLIALVVLEALIAAISFRNYGVASIPVGVGISAGVLIALDVVVHRPRLVWSALVAAFQLVISSMIGAFVESYLYYGYGVATGGLYYLELVTGFIFLLVVQIGLAYYISRGRVWVNLTLTSIIVDVAFIFTVNLLRVDFTVALLIDLGLVLIYFALRTLRFRRGAKPSLPQRSAGSLRKAVKFFQDRDFATVEPDASYPWLDVIANNGRTVYAAVVVDPHNTLGFGGNVLSQDGQDITFLFEYALRDMRRWARNKRIPLSRMQMLVFTHKSSLDPAYRALRVRARHTPERVLGTIALVNHAGLDKLMKAHAADKPFNKRLQQRVLHVQAN